MEHGERRKSVPISCPLELRCLTENEFEEVDFRVMGHAFASQNELGRLCEEGIYQRDLRARLLAEGGGDVQVEVPVTVSHADFSKTYLIDLVAHDAVYELKAVAALTRKHEAQLLHYLFLLGVQRGKLLNFRSPKVAGRICATSLTPDARRLVKVDTTRWQDVTSECAALRLAMLELLADWGAFLEIALYQEALTHFLGGEPRVIQRLPLQRGGLALGMQRFHMHTPGAAFWVTAVSERPDASEAQLRRLLALTELRALQWINLKHAEAQFVTLAR